MDATLTLSSGGAALWLRFEQDRLPYVVHWGAELPITDAAAVSAVTQPAFLLGPDHPVPVSVLPEARFGFTGRPGLEGHRGRGDWSVAWAVQSVTVDRAPVGDGLTEHGPGLVEVIAADFRAALGLRLQIEMLGSGLIRLRAEISNTGSAPYQVNAVTLRLPVPRAEELLDSAGHWGAERSPQRMPFSVGCHLREGRAGRTGADAAYLMHAGVSGFSFQQGQVWAVHTAWSGNHTTVAERTSYGRWLGGGELLLPGEVVLAEQQSYRSPWLYGSYGVGLDAVAHRFHRYLRSRPQHPSPQRPVTLNSWEAMYFDLSTEALIELVDAGAAVGVERFVIDDGWFGSRRDDYRGLGDWWVSPEVFPEGLHAVARRCAEHGIQLGLWVEPEMVNLDSDLARAHPDWVLQVPGRMPPEQRHQQVLDLTVPEAYRQLRDRLLALLDEYPIGYLKWDHNRDLVEPGSVLAGGAAAVHEQTLAAYRLMAELKAHRPGLEIESCSSGGGRVDLQVLEVADRVWASDCTDAAERLRIQRWTYGLLPPELVGCHISATPNHQTLRVHSLAFRAATALFGHLGVEWDLRRLSDADREQLRWWIERYRQLRGLIGTGDLVRVDTADGLYLTGVVAPDRSQAWYVMVATTTCALDIGWGRFRLPGLDPQRRYRVRPHRPGTDVVDPSLLPGWFAEPDQTSWAGLEISGAWLGDEGLEAPHLPVQIPLLLEVRAV